MLRPLSVSTAFAFLVLSGLVHGLWTSRWQKSHALEAAAARVADVPLLLGDWKGRELETDPTMFARAGCEAYWMRRYENEQSGSSLSVILMCGRAGPMSVHTPEVCYGGAGYSLSRPPALFPVSEEGRAEPAHCWTAIFQKEQPGDFGRLRLFWCWGASGSWQAPERPRWTFRGEAALYKLYIIHETAADEMPQTSAGAAFLGQFLPELNKVLFPPSSL